MESLSTVSRFGILTLQVDNSYQIKRAIKAMGKEKGLALMSSSGIKRNSGDGPKLQEFASLSDLKAEKRKKKNHNVKNQ